MYVNYVTMCISNEACNEINSCEHFYKHVLSMKRELCE